MKKIKLSRNKYTVVDDEDYEKLIKYNWCLSVQGYAVNSKNNLLMHRFILNLTKDDGNITDHINRNKLDNRKSNLRLCNRTKNAFNSSRHVDSVSNYKGVCWEKQTNKWKAQICIDGKVKNLGRYVLEELAALAYDIAATKYHKEFASFNF